MDQSAIFLITLGCVLLLGLATDAIGRFTRLPRVSLLLVFGLLVGPEVLDFLPVEDGRWFSISANCALAMVGFLLGERFTADYFREHGREVMILSLAAVLVTATLVGLGLILLGVPTPLALLLGALSASTAPAATADTVRERGSETSFSQILLSVVAIDDAWALLLFAGVTAWVGTQIGEDTIGSYTVLGEVGGSLLLGVGLGLPLAFLTGRVRPGEPTLLEALGVVFLSAGLAIWLEVSPILTAMTLGATVANLARHHTRPFHAIEEIERPFMVLFFIFAGAALRFDEIERIGAVGVFYIALRAGGRVFGGWVGSVLSRAPGVVRRWLGLALMPQAGIALGLALVSAERFPQQGQVILPVAIGATVIFELLGPLCTSYALSRADREGARLDY